MIDTKRYNIEPGDKVRLTLEGVVEDGWDPLYLSATGGRYLCGVFLTGWDKPEGCTLEILEKAPPAWHSAQYIEASFDGGDPNLRLRLMKTPDSDRWIDNEGDIWYHSELLNVEVIIP